MIDAFLARMQAHGQLLGNLIRSWWLLAPLLTATLLATVRLLQSLHLIGGKTWMVFPVLVLAGGLGAARQVQNQRKGWSSALADDPIPARDARPHVLGVVPSAKADRYIAPGETVAPYVARSVDARAQELLAKQRFVLLVGAPGSGATRTAMEAVKHVDPGAKLIRLARPSSECTQPLAALLAALLPLSLRRCVIWLGDIGASIETGEITCATLEAFLRHHRGVRIIATMHSLPYDKIASSEDPISAAARELLRRADKVIVPIELGAAELDEAERLYPGIERDALRRLAAYFNDSESREQRFRLGEQAEPAGYAVVRVAIDLERCGVGRPVNEAFLRRAHPLYLDGARTSDRQFMAARGWAEKPMASGHALIEPAAEASGWRPASSLVEYVEHQGFQIPAGLWTHAIEEIENEPGELLALGTAAAARREHLIARRAFLRAMQIGDDGHRELAARRLALLDDATQSGAPVAELVRRAADRGALRGIELRAPVAVKRPPREGDWPFDPSVPQLRRSLSTRLYSHQTLRFCGRTLVLVALDIAGILGGLGVAFAVKAALRGESVLRILAERWPLGLYDVSIALTLLALIGGYRDDCRRAVFHRIALALGVAAALTGMIGASRGAGLLYSTCAWISFVFAIPLCHMLRTGYDRTSQSWVRRHGLQTRTLLIGSHAGCSALAAVLLGSGGRPKNFVGYLVPGPERDRTPACLGTLASLSDVIERYRIHHVIIADPAYPVADALELGDRCLLAGATLERVLSSVEEQVYDTEFGLDVVPTLHRIRPPMLGVDVQAIKRSFDLTLTILVLPIAVPVMGLIALAIKLDSPGPVLARSHRPGRGGHPFRMLKFRTTASVPAAERSGLGSGAVASRDERELMRVGRVLRRFSLDELPQLFNVLRGEMSLVGPRPLPRSHYDRLSEAQRRRYLVVPGFTGPWQISGRPINYDEMVRVDLRYMRTWSLAGDLEILLKTVPAILRGRSTGSGGLAEP